LLWLGRLRAEARTSLYNVASAAHPETLDLPRRDPKFSRELRVPGATGEAIQQLISLLICKGEISRVCGGRCNRGRTAGQVIRARPVPFHRSNRFARRTLGLTHIGDCGARYKLLSAARQLDCPIEWQALQRLDEQPQTANCRVLGQPDEFDVLDHRQPRALGVAASGGLEGALRHLVEKRR
jgi:hypothetical protein